MLSSRFPRLASLLHNQVRLFHSSAPLALRIGDTAPDFTQACWNVPDNKISFHKWLNGKWGLLVSHPADFTPVCTTELAELARLTPELEKRNVMPLGHSVDRLPKHEKWVKDIAEYGKVNNIPYPIIADADRTVAKKYDMLDDNLKDEEGLPLSVRSVYLVDPTGKIRLILTYPASTGRYWPEVIRAIDSIQLSEKHPIATPHGWQPGGEVVVKPSISTEEAKKMYPKINVVKPYLRLIPQPK